MMMCCRLVGILFRQLCGISSCVLVVKWWIMLVKLVLFWVLFSFRWLDFSIVIGKVWGVLWQLLLEGWCMKDMCSWFCVVSVFGGMCVMMCLCWLLVCRLCVFSSILLRNIEVIGGVCVVFGVVEIFSISLDGRWLLLVILVILKDVFQLVWLSILMLLGVLFRFFSRMKFLFVIGLCVVCVISEVVLLMLCQQWLNICVKVGLDCVFVRIIGWLKVDDSCSLFVCRLVDCGCMWVCQVLKVGIVLGVLVCICCCRVFMVLLILESSVVLVIMMLVCIWLWFRVSKVLILVGFFRVCWLLFLSVVNVVMLCSLLGMLRWFRLIMLFMCGSIVIVLCLFVCFSVILMCQVLLQFCVFSWCFVIMMEVRVGSVF